MISVIIFVKICFMIQDMVHLNTFFMWIRKEYKYHLDSIDSYSVYLFCIFAGFLSIGSIY